MGFNEDFLEYLKDVTTFSKSFKNPKSFFFNQDLLFYKQDQFISFLIKDVLILQLFRNYLATALQLFCNCSATILQLFRNYLATILQRSKVMNSFKRCAKVQTKSPVNPRIRAQALI